jgi:hypothetical protein
MAMDSPFEVAGADASVKATRTTPSVVVRDGDRRRDLGTGPHPELAEHAREVGYGQRAHEDLLRRLGFAA